MVWTVNAKKLLALHPLGEHSILWMRLGLKEKQLMQQYRIVKLGCHYVFWLTALLNKLFCAMSALSRFPHWNYSQLPSWLPTVLPPASLPFLRHFSVTCPALNQNHTGSASSLTEEHASSVFRQIPAGQTHPYEKKRNYPTSHIILLGSFP